MLSMRARKSMDDLGFIILDNGRLYNIYDLENEGYFENQILDNIIEHINIHSNTLHQEIYDKYAEELKKVENMLVVNKRTGQVEYFETFEHYMDDELRERVAWELAPCSEEDFLDRYVYLHYETFAEEFVIN